MITAPRPLRPALRAVTYTRWLHLFMGSVIAVLVAFVTGTDDVPEVLAYAGMALAPVPLLALAAAVPGARVAEAAQARMLLFPGPRAREGQRSPGLASTPSASWADRGRVFVWLVLRTWVGFLATVVTFNGIFLMLALTTPSLWRGFSTDGVHLPGGWQPFYPLLVPVAAAAVLAAVWAFGALMAALAPRFLGPSAAERVAWLEERTERLLEHNRLARELHDTIGHALTVAVVQAGAARTARSPEFTERALTAIEDTGREALDDLDRVLRLLRQDGGPATRRPGLDDAGRLVESARGAGAQVRTEMHGALAAVPGPVSREGYRMLQECLTNVLRHAGPVPVTVRVAVADGRLELAVRNELPAGPPAPRSGGSGLRGVRERAALLGGEAECGPYDGEWRVRVRLPLQ